MSQPYDRVFNFSAGPSTLPVEVLEQAQKDFLNYQGAGMSVMEMSHRGGAYDKIAAKTEADLRALMGIPENYHVMFLQGGASLQFSMLPMSFLPEGRTADYVITGAWGKKALEGAQLVGKTHVPFDGKAGHYSDVPDLEGLTYTPDAAYLHFTSNETIQGVQFQSDPTLGAPTVCDMSSDILCRPVDVSKYAMIYAGAQKNMGPSGATLLILSDAFLQNAPESTHPMLDYRLQVANEARYNTPPTWCIYICGLVYAHLLERGGLEGVQKRNEEKAQLLYQAIDGSEGFYKGHAEKACRSTMNVTFTLPSEELTELFLKEAKGARLDGLKGHRSVGGCRASIYNAFPKEGCEVLAEFMVRFAQNHRLAGV